jgi:hypothetical protein
MISNQAFNFSQIMAAKAAIRGQRYVGVQPELRALVPSVNVRMPPLSAIV